MFVPVGGSLVAPVLRLYFVLRLVFVVGFLPYRRREVRLPGDFKVKFGHVDFVARLERNAQRLRVLLHSYHGNARPNHVKLLRRGIRQVYYAARAATVGRTTVSRAPAASTSGSGAAVARSAVARAGTTQKVISTGTKVAAANENVVVSQECREKYYGCMDSFCMLDNASGGRCICSDRNAELNDILAQIEELDQQSYQMATYGVERIEMGDAAETAIANANAVAQAILDEQDKGPL